MLGGAAHVDPGRRVRRVCEAVCVAVLLPHIRRCGRCRTHGRANMFREASLRCASCAQARPVTRMSASQLCCRVARSGTGVCQNLDHKCTAAEGVLLCAACVWRESRRKSRAGAKRGWNPLLWGAEPRPRRVSPMSPPRRRLLMPCTPNRTRRTRWLLPPPVCTQCVLWGHACPGTYMLGSCVRSSRARALA
jgi:hypothetical protein